MAFNKKLTLEGLQYYHSKIKALFSNTNKSISDEVTRATNAENDLESKKLDKTTVAGENLGLVKSGTDITVDNSGNVSVNDDSHNHVISNVDGLQSALEGKASTSHTHSDYASKSVYDDTTVSMGRESGSTVGYRSFAFGMKTIASGSYSHAEGIASLATGYNSHAEGGSTASGDDSHAEGGSTASGRYSHAEGKNTTASGRYSHAEGQDTIASGKCQHVSGKYNEEDSGDKYAVIVGGGTSDTERKNILTLDWDGLLDANGYGFGDTCTNPTKFYRHDYEGDVTDEVVTEKTTIVGLNAGMYIQGNLEAANFKGLAANFTTENWNMAAAAPLVKQLYEENQSLKEQLSKLNSNIDELKHTNYYVGIGRQTVSSQGWYRIAQFVNSDQNGRNGAIDNSIDIILKRAFGNTDNEHHELKFLSIYNNRKFVSVANLSNSQKFTKIRYTSDGFLELYYSGTNSNMFTYTILNRYDAALSGFWEKVFEKSSTTDDRVLCTFDIPEND